MKVLYTGGNGKYAQELKTVPTNLDIRFPTRQECDLTDQASIVGYCRKEKYFDIVVTGANQFPGDCTGLNLNSFIINSNHIYLVEQLESRPKYFINLTTGMTLIDEHYMYRAQKIFAEHVAKFYFRFGENTVTRFINFHPHHVDDPKIRKISSLGFMKILENIEEYNEVDYVINLFTGEPENLRF